MKRGLQLGACFGGLAFLILLIHPLTLPPNTPPPTTWVNVLVLFAAALTLFAQTALITVRLWRSMRPVHALYDGHDRITLTCSLLR